MRLRRQEIFRAERGRTFSVARAGAGLNFATLLPGRRAEGTTLARGEVEELHAALGTWLESRRRAEGRP